MPAAIRSVLLVLVAPVLAACVGGASAADPSSAVEDRPAPTVATSALRTVVERRVGGAALLMTITQTSDRAVGVMEVVDETGQRTLAAEEIRIGTDRYVHLAMAEDAVFDRPAWIHLDMTDEHHVAFAEQNELGVIEQAAAFDAEVGDAFGSDVVRRVERLGGGRRVLHLVDGIPVHVRRTSVHPAPRIAVPDSLPVVPLHDLEQLAPGSR